jgi:hypothetical protein
MMVRRARDLMARLLDVTGHCQIAARSVHHYRRTQFPILQALPSAQTAAEQPVLDVQPSDLQQPGAQARCGVAGVKLAVPGHRAVADDCDIDAFVCKTEDEELIAELVNHFVGYYASTLSRVSACTGENTARLVPVAESSRGVLLVPRQYKVPLLEKLRSLQYMAIGSSQRETFVVKVNGSLTKDVLLRALMAIGTPVQYMAIGQKEREAAFHSNTIMPLFAGRGASETCPLNVWDLGPDERPAATASCDMEFDLAHYIDVPEGMPLVAQLGWITPMFPMAQEWLAREPGSNVPMGGYACGEARHLRMDDASGIGKWKAYCPLYHLITSVLNDASSSCPQTIGAAKTAGCRLRKLLRIARGKFERGDPLFETRDRASNGTERERDEWEEEESDGVDEDDDGGARAEVSDDATSAPIAEAIAANRAWLSKYCSRLRIEVGDRRSRMSNARGVYGRCVEMELSHRYGSLEKSGAPRTTLRSRPKACWQSGASRSCSLLIRGAVRLTVLSSVKTGRRCAFRRQSVGTSARCLTMTGWALCRTRSTSSFGTSPTRQIESSPMWSVGTFPCRSVALVWPRGELTTPTFGVCLLLTALFAFSMHRSPRWTKANIIAAKNAGELRRVDDPVLEHDDAAQEDLAFLRGSDAPPIPLPETPINDKAVIILYARIHTHQRRFNAAAPSKHRCESYLKTDGIFWAHDGVYQSASRTPNSFTKELWAIDNCLRPSVGFWPDVFYNEVPQQIIEDNRLYLQRHRRRGLPYPEIPAEDLEPRPVHGQSAPLPPCSPPVFDLIAVISPPGALGLSIADNKRPWMTYGPSISRVDGDGVMKSLRVNDIIRHVVGLPEWARKAPVTAIQVARWMQAHADSERRFLVWRRVVRKGQSPVAIDPAADAVVSEYTASCAAARAYLRQGAETDQSERVSEEEGAAASGGDGGDREGDQRADSNNADGARDTSVDDAVSRRAKNTQKEHAKMKQDAQRRRAAHARATLALRRQSWAEYVAASDSAFTQDGAPFVIGGEVSFIRSFATSFIARMCTLPITISPVGLTLYFRCRHVGLACAARVCAAQHKPRPP